MVVVVSVAALGVIGVVLAEIEAVSVETAVGMAEEAALAIKVEVALEAEADSQTAHLRPMRRVDQAECEAGVMVVGMEVAQRMELDLTMATVAGALDMAPVATTVVVRAAHPGLTAVETNAVG